MRAVITGAGGQLGHDLIRVLAPDHRLYAYTKAELDVTNMERVREAVEDARPDVIIHAGAYTNVDRAEGEAEHVFQVNAIGTRNMAVAAQASGAKLVYVSTGYVFDGRKKSPYHEFDQPSPISVYGVSKWAGEQYVQMFCDRFFIVRTSWLYGCRGNNFVSKIVALAERSDSLSIVNDQFGSPTYSLDLAEAIGRLMATDRYGIYHAANEGGCSRLDFVQFILDELGMHGIRLVPCSSEQFTAAAARPANSVFDSLALRLNGMPPLRDWRTALRLFLKHDYRRQEVIGND
ncbi:dTDP-4-dehydrorhamnose reductase [Paenibacillus flagellatus]|uniref:dTDP-4-dehydrorhamnose reductase n=1 Tax=Paenibacillus flagellatus TaxID=2211139 RepID=A0A2V5KSQ4_9BACL|nr:dTDP-4-dehydrorhamnose reductase [Paenibacillus flagellatus]PYI52106.1 dTDP-4-dehydrorhamnose reductase [Paenibacillus flagellatus]